MSFIEQNNTNSSRSALRQNKVFKSTLSVSNQAHKGFIADGLANSSRNRVSSMYDQAKEVGFASVMMLRSQSARNAQHMFQNMNYDIDDEDDFIDGELLDGQID